MATDALTSRRRKQEGETVRSRERSERSWASFLWPLQLTSGADTRPGELASMRRVDVGRERRREGEGRLVGGSHSTFLISQFIPATSLNSQINSSELRKISGKIVLRG